MNKKIILARSLKSIPIAILIMSFLTSIYAVKNNISEMTYSASIIFLILISLYYLGIYLEYKTKKGDNL